MQTSQTQLSLRAPASIKLQMRKFISERDRVNPGLLKIGARLRVKKGIRRIVMHCVMIQPIKEIGKSRLKILSIRPMTPKTEKK